MREPFALIEKRLLYPTAASLAHLCRFKPRRRRIAKADPKPPRDLAGHQARCGKRFRIIPVVPAPDYVPPWAPLTSRVDTVSTRRRFEIVGSQAARYLA